MVGSIIPPRKQQRGQGSAIARYHNALATRLWPSWKNGLASAIIFAIVGILVIRFIDWAVVSATFSGTTRADCVGDGACWIPIKLNLGFFIHGPYPVDQRWRLDVSFVLGILAFALLFWRNCPPKILLGYLVLLPIVLWVLMKGGVFWPTEPSSSFGGIALTFFLGAIAMVLSLPVAVLLALGRQSRLPLIRWLCVGYIEMIRAVPILIFLFMASLVFQIFLPSNWDVDKLLRVLAVMVMVSAAYKAEIIRGGIQGVPKGQVEAAQALGASYWQIAIFIVLPQALRSTVPPLIGNFIGLFKETTLVLIVGLSEIIATVRSAMLDAEWRGIHLEGMIFTSLFFFVVCFSISRYGLVLEKRISESQR